MKKKRSFLLTDCNVLNVNEGTVLDNASVRIEKGIITALGTELTPKKGEKVISLSGGYLCPGLIDAHVHLFGSGVPKKIIASKGEGQKRLVKFASTWLGHIVLHHLAKEALVQTLNSGTTTVRSLGDLQYADIWAKKALRKGRFLGPKLLSSGYAVTTKNGHGVGSISKGCESKEEFIKAIDENIAHGVDWIKLMVTSGAMDASDGEIPGVPRMSLEQIKWCVDYAHSKGLKVSAHCESSEGVTRCVEGGIDTIEHGAILEDGILDKLCLSTSRIITTLSPALPAAKLGQEQSKYTDGQVAAVNCIYEGIVSSALSCYEIGLPVGLGTDASCPFATHTSMWREICFYKKVVRCTNQEALYAGTLGNAKILGLANTVGSIDLGKDADFIVLSSNPFDDLRALKEVKEVFVRGVPTKRKAKRYGHLEDVLDSLID